MSHTSTMMEATATTTSPSRPQIRLEPALDVLDRALKGDAGARSFLDRTSSIYVLDVTDVSKPKTYGCWNFIHQAMNEVERMEQQKQSHAQNFGGGFESLAIQGHVQLLATMALRVARRSTMIDKILVTTCIENAAKYHASPNEAQHLIDLNLELRDIVMGRIAAMAFDPSFHKDNVAATISSSPQHISSSFCDFVVMETFCAVVAANAISNGPAAVKHLVTEWIVPSVQTLPPFALASVTLHLASESISRSKSAPENTRDMCQQLSNAIMATVLGPVLLGAIKEEGDARAHERNSRIAATALRAMERWCSATDLSLAQIKHICRKVQIDIVDILSDTMYSDSRQVLDALAEFIEDVVDRHIATTSSSGTVSEERMTQVRYIMQVDEISFRSNISPDQLILIESKEMESILQELISAVGLQRFRFMERQNNGDRDVCRNLTRIAASVCKASKASPDGGASSQSHPVGTAITSVGPGLLDLLMKAAGHPSVHICGIAMDVLSEAVPYQIGLSRHLLPTLQRRAIAPHHFVSPTTSTQSNGGSAIPSLAAADVCGVNYHEFQNFRETVLTDALVACWKDDGENYMASCTSAIEEFCSQTASSELSFHLEAALFCLSAVADEVLMHGVHVSASSRDADNDNKDGTNLVESSFEVHLERCTSALSGKPASFTTNPLTLSQLCRFIRKYCRWYGRRRDDGALNVATELAISTFNLAASEFPSKPAAVEMRREASISPFSEASKALRALLCQAPQRFLSNHAIATLGAGWEASYAASNRIGIISCEDRQELCIGICHVLSSLPYSQRAKSLHALAMPALDCLETMTQHANHHAASRQPSFASSPNNASASMENFHLQLDLILNRIADEIALLTTMARTFTDAFAMKDASMESGCRTSDGHAAIVEPAFSVIQKAWPSIAHVAATYKHNCNLSNAIGKFLVECLPPECQDSASLALLKELCSIASSMLQMESTTSRKIQFQPVLEFLQAFVKIHGDVVDKNAIASSEGRSTPSNTERGREVGSCLESLLLSTVDAIRNSLGTTWTGSQTQGQGQPPFESKAEPIDEHRQTSNEALPAVFSLLRICAERCPVFLLSLPAAPGLDRNDDLLYCRAVESAVASLVEVDAETCRSAMQYLESTVRLTRSLSNDVRHIVEEILSGVKSNIITTLLVGSCGKLNGATLDDAASLISRVLLASPSSTTELESTVRQALNPEYFLLGDKAKTVSVGVLMRCARNEASVSSLSVFLRDLWELHQIDYLDSLEGSDAVARFCRQYASS